MPQSSVEKAGQPERRRKHLIDFDNPPPRTSVAERDAGLSKVQQRVMSALLLTTVLHFIGGLVIFAHSIDGHLDAKVGLLVICVFLGLGGMVAALAIHERSPLSWWLLAGPVPAIIGAIWVL